MGMSNQKGNQTWTIRYYIQTVTWFVLSLIGALFILGFPGLCAFRYGILVDDYQRNPALFVNDTSIVAKLMDPMNPPKPRTAYLFMTIGCVYIVLCAFLFGEALTAGIMAL